jgi:hypothetical protein
MGRRAEYTAILATDNATWRVDFDRSFVPRPGSPQKVNESSERSIVTAARAIAESEQGPGRSVVIFSTAVWSNLIRLPQTSLYGLTADELLTALKYEVETLAGIDAEDSAITAVELTSSAGNRLFWVNAIPESEWSAVVELLSGHGVRTITLLHPAAASSSDLGIDGDGVLYGIQYWQGTASIRNGAGELLGTRQMPLDQANMLSLVQGVDASATLGQSCLTIDPDCVPADFDVASFNTITRLSEAEILASWLRNAALSVFQAGGRPFPGLVHRYKLPSGIGQWVAASVLIAALTGLCAWHYYWLNGVHLAMQRELRAIEEPAILKQNYDKLSQLALEERAKATQLAAQSKIDLKKVQFLFTQQTDRNERLLELLARLRTSELVVKSITPEEKGIVVEGVSINGDSAPLMANRLRDLAAPMGWRIHPASQTGELKMTSGGPWLFRILLEDIGPPELAAGRVGQTSGDGRSSAKRGPLASKTGFGGGARR